MTYFFKIYNEEFSSHHEWKSLSVKNYFFTDWHDI